MSPSPQTPSSISYSSLRNTLKSLEGYAAKKKLKSYDTMTTISHYVTRSLTSSKSIRLNSLVIQSRHSCTTGTKGGNVSLFKNWKMPGRIEDREGRGGKSIYESSRPVNITNGVLSFHKKILKIPAVPTKTRPPLLSNPFIFIDPHIPDEKKVLITKFLREGQTGETVTTFYERLVKQDDGSSDSDDTPLPPVNPFGIGAIVGGATKSGAVKKGKVVKLHSDFFVYVRWGEEKWNKKVKKEKLSILEPPPPKIPKRTPTPPLDSSSDESDDGLNTLSGLAQDADHPLPVPSSTEFWSDTTPFPSATRLTAEMREKRKTSTRKVTRSDLAREARDGTPAKAVDINKRTSKVARLNRRVSFKEDEVSSVDSQTFSFTGDNDEVEESPFLEPDIRTEITRRGGGGRVFNPTNTSKHRSSHSRSTPSPSFLSPDPDPLPLAPPRIARNKSNTSASSSDNSVLLPSRNLGVGFSAAVLGTTPSDFGSPPNKRKKGSKYGKRGAARLTAFALERHTKNTKKTDNDDDDDDNDDVDETPTPLVAKQKAPTPTADATQSQTQNQLQTQPKTPTPTADATRTQSQTQSQIQPQQKSLAVATSQKYTTPTLQQKKVLGFYSLDEDNDDDDDQTKAHTILSKNDPSVDGLNINNIILPTDAKENEDNEDLASAYTFIPQEMMKTPQQLFSSNHGT
ncbi:hypothetical protein TrST_g10739 [Triparma strigata]|uniref:Uncharacterized protein n=1 Tax=Triparma strigata TaxID=1606541 RepID=A0A9W7EYQ2_9STRA|nr:hypothetical protein TrST_g10739 [Triparma strigata]